MINSICKNDLIFLLFKTNALRICSENKPFWYTSGTIGPYYINTHFLFGNEENANELLGFIDLNKTNKLELPTKLIDRIKDQYIKSQIFSQLIQILLAFINNEFDAKGFDYISGGERRDWFFSLMIAEVLKKPHLMIFKDLRCVLTKDGYSTYIDNLNGKKVLHVADLVTEASSFERYWIPAIRERRGEMSQAIAIVDRNQGGNNFFDSKQIQYRYMIKVDNSLFERAFEMNSINNGQYSMLKNYLIDPKDSMEEFLKKNPEFIKDSLNSNNRTKERVQYCITNKVYNI